ncbi:hypothetical protein OCJ37_14190 [Xanthomonas sp. AM6]|uniref:hypothetical protein n=1 Tax=Xanthomonas sp. AM6 TaxID=2982531 RepID=UPI0021D9C8FD|nr:hypothetical protein [Xanthomonas sp. AM6]UYB51135.1 hypothetical protein OCJ37_14190 [Xanthomonas sp. AM6]
MAQSVPRTILKDLLHRANELLHSGRWTEFDVKRLAAEAEKLSRSDALGALEVKAMVSVLDNDLSSADALYDRVLRATGGSEQRLVRYLHLLAFSGQPLKLMSVFKGLVADEGTLSPAARAHIAQALGYCGWLSESGRIRDELSAAGHSIGDTSISELEYPEDREGESQGGGMAILSKQHFLTAPFVIEQNSVDPEALAVLVGEVHSFLRSRGAPASAVRGLSSPRDDGTSSVMMNFVVKAEAEEASDLEWSLYGHLAQQESALLADGVVTIGLISGCQ